jgi:hypothetical protein
MLPRMCLERIFLSEIGMNSARLSTEYVKNILVCYCTETWRNKRSKQEMRRARKKHSMYERSAVLTAVIMKNIVIWDVTSCALVGVSWLSNPCDKDSTFFRNVHKYLPGYTTSHSRRKYSSNFRTRDTLSTAVVSTCCYQTLLAMESPAWLFRHCSADQGSPLRFRPSQTLFLTVSTRGRRQSQTNPHSCFTPNVLKIVFL